MTKLMQGKYRLLLRKNPELNTMKCSFLEDKTGILRKTEEQMTITCLFHSILV